MQYKKQKFCGFQLISLALLMLIPTAFAESDNLSTGKLEYRKGNYQQALTYFDTALKKDPSNATALYYRANTLVSLGLNTQALIDYQQAYKLTNSTTMRDYCLDAMSSITSSTNRSFLNSKPISKNPTEIMKQYQLDQSLGSIQLQSALDKVRIIGNSKLFAQDYDMKQQLKLAEMKRETEQQAQTMQNASYYDMYGNKHPIYSPKQVQDYLDQRHQTEQTTQDSIQKSVQGQTAFAQQRAQLTQESAINLANQLEARTSPDGVKLDPLGTNLYVRNYDFTNNTDSLPKPPTALTAKEKTFK